MKMSEGIIQAYQRKWSMINTFTVSIDMSDKLADVVGRFTPDVNLNIVSVNTTQFTNDAISIFQMNKWKIHTGREALYRFDITFRDQNQLELYRKFVKMYKYSLKNYFDDCKLSITVKKDADYVDEVDSDLIQYTGCLIEAVSQVQFSNTTDGQIAEFSVSFMANNVEVFG